MQSVKENEDSTPEPALSRKQATRRKYPRTNRQQEHYLESFLSVTDCEDFCYVRVHCVDPDRKLFRINWWNAVNKTNQFIYRSQFMRLDKVNPEGPILTNLVF